MPVSEVELMIERVHLSLEAFSRGDFDSAALYIHPEVEWHAAFRLPDLRRDVYSRAWESEGEARADLGLVDG
jgi:hypothetical protein